MRHRLPPRLLVIGALFASLGAAAQVTPAEPFGGRPFGAPPGTPPPAPQQPVAPAAQPAIVIQAPAQQPVVPAPAPAPAVVQQPLPAPVPPAPPAPGSNAGRNAPQTGISAPAMTAPPMAAPQAPAPAPPPVAAPAPVTPPFTTGGARPGASAAGSGAQVPVRGLPAEAPRVVITGSVYSPDPARRMLIVNGQVVREGADLGSGLVLQEVKPEGAVLGYKGATYSVMF